MRTKTAGKAGKATRSRRPARGTAPVERQVAVPTSIGDMSPAQRVWIAAEVLHDAPREEVIQVAKKLGVKTKAAAAQFQLARYGQRMRALADVLPPSLKSTIVHAGMQVHNKELGRQAK